MGTQELARRRGWSWFALTAAIAAAMLTPVAGAIGGATVDPAVRQARGLVRVIVQSVTRDGSAERAVVRAGGRVTHELPIIDGFAATVPAARIDEIAHAGSLRAITLDGPLHVMGGGTPGHPSTTSVYPKVVRANELNALGMNGTGVTVALIDTGIADVPDLSGRVLPVQGNPGAVPGTNSPCINLSGEPDCTDSYGHGTFIAGLIAGNGASSNGKWKGTAPGANLVSVKIAGRDGSADVSGVLAAIQWVVSFKDQYNIRVMNLSLGTDSTQTYRTDPLNYAVERAWTSGIVVVVSASNRGPGAGTISKPGDDPWVITVGATDDNGTKGVGDDSIPDFSSRGPTAADGIAKPDVAAPGGHVISLRAPGSAIDTQFPTYVDGSYRKGSGTSMSAGVVSGVVADMLQADPTRTPDRVKFTLTSTARATASTDHMAVGSGVIDAYAATFTAPPGVANIGLDRSSGLGSLDASRGSVQVAMNDPLGTILSTETTAQVLLWDPVTYTGASWYGASWYGASWYGASWYGASWYGASWYGASWYGTPDGASWYGASWYGASWYGAWE